MYNYTKRIETIAECDVLVVGGGSAGVSATTAAARGGAKTILIDKNGFLGGISTAVLDTFYGFYTPGSHSIRVVGGIGTEVQQRLNAYGMALERPNTFGAGTGITYHPDYLKVVWEAMAREAGANVMLHASVVDVVREGDRVTGAVVALKSGLGLIRAHTFVDASGDADLCFLAGLPFELAGETEPAQTLTTTFRMVNVDLQRRGSIDKTAFHALMARAADEQGYRLPRKEGSDHKTPVPHTTATIMTRLPSFMRRDGLTINATDPALLSESEMAGRQQALEYIRFLKDVVPGYEKAELGTFGAHIGVRETRRIEGEYWLTEKDVLSARQFDDQIGLCGAPIEDHHGGSDTTWIYLPEGQCVGLPYRTLQPRDIENVLVAGRCFSASHGAHASVRSIGQCIVMGQAAGTAAAIAAANGWGVREIPVADLQHRLRAEGAVLETPR